VVHGDRDSFLNWKGNIFSCFQFTFFQNEIEYEWLCREYEKLAAGETGVLSHEDKKNLAREMLRFDP